MSFGSQPAPPQVQWSGSGQPQPQYPTPPAQGNPGSDGGLGGQNSDPGPNTQFKLQTGSANWANDYLGAADAQGASARQNIGQQTQANRPNQNTAFGFSNWVQGPDGQWRQQTGLNPELQQALSGLQGQAAANAGRPFDNGSAARDQAITGAYNQATSRLNPQFDQRQEQLQAQLANQGLDPNSQAYRTAMQQFSQQRNDAYSSAMNNAIGQGTAAQQATFGENMQAQMAPYQQMQALYGLGGMPTFASAGTAGQTPYLDAMLAYGNQALGQATQENQANGQALQAGGTAIGAIGAATVAAASDARVKQNIQRLPVDVLPGVPLALFEYRSQPGKQYAGVIAQDLEKVAPDQVQEGPDGIKRVTAPFIPFSFGDSK